MNARDVLREAKALLLDGGWIKGEEKIWSEQHGRYRYCAIGAVSQIVHERGVASRTSQRAFAALNEAVEGDIVAFNDSRARTADQVIDKFDEAIALLAPPVPVAQREERAAGSSPAGDLETVMVSTT